MNLTIAAVEDPPRAADDTYTVSEDQSLTIAAPGLLQNDADPEGDALSTAVAAPPSHGHARPLDQRDGFTYTPAPNYHGTDSFNYTLSDAKGGSDAGNASLVVSPVNDVPVALDDALATKEDVPLVVAAPGLLANDSDLDADALVVTLAVAPAHGSVVLAPCGGFTYTPAAHFYGQDSQQRHRRQRHGD